MSACLRSVLGRADTEPLWRAGSVRDWFRGSPMARFAGSTKRDMVSMDRHQRRWSDGDKHLGHATSLPRPRTRA
jgi:hypothetical protein